jgi:hypothetical protein
LGSLILFEMSSINSDLVSVDDMDAYPRKLAELQES